MSIAAGIRRPRRSDTGPLAPAMRMASTMAEVSGASYDNFLWNDRANSEGFAYRQAYDEMVAPFFDQLEDDDPSFDRRDVYQRSKRFFSEPSTVLGRPAINNQEATYAYLYSEAEKRGRLDTLPSWAEFDAAATKRSTEMATARAKTFEETMAAYGGSSAGAFWGAAVGAIPALVQDPVVIGATLASLPIAAVTSIPRMAMLEAAIGGLTEVPIQMAAQDWYEKQGRELTPQEMATNIGIAAAFGGVLGGLGAGAYRAFGGTNKEMFGFMRYSAADRLKALQDNLAGNLLIDPGNELFGTFDEPFLLPRRALITGEGPDKLADATPTDQMLFTYNSFATHLLDTEWNAFSPVVPVDRVMADVAAETPDLELKATMWAQAKDISINYRTNPAYAMRDPSVTSGVDKIVWTHQSRTLTPLHRANLKEAVQALNEGRAPQLQSMGKLSLEISLADATGDASRAVIKRQATAEVEDILTRTRPLTLKSGRVRKVITGLLNRAYREKMEDLINETRPLWPDDGKYVKQPKAPVTDARLAAKVEKAEGKVAEIDAKLREAQADLKRVTKNERARTETKIKRLNAGAKEARRLGREHQRAIDADQTPPAMPEGFRDAATIEADIARLRSEAGPDETKAKSVVDGLVEQRKQAMEAVGRAWAGYRPLELHAQEVLRVDKINQGIRAQKNLDALEAGRVPHDPTLKALEARTLRQLEMYRENTVKFTSPERPGLPKVLQAESVSTIKNAKLANKINDQDANGPDAKTALKRETEALDTQAKELPQAVLDEVGYAEATDAEDIMNAAGVCSTR